MHIALTVGSFDRTGGIERVTVELALGYRALGHHVTVYATEWDAAFEDRFEFIRVNAPDAPAWLRTITLPQATARALAGRRYDFVHGQGTSTLRSDLLTFHSVHAAWLAVSVASDGAWSPRGLAKRLYPFHRAAIAMERRQVASHRGLFHACSKEVRDEVIHYYHADPDRVVAIPWGIDMTTFAPDETARAIHRTAWRLPDDALVLAFVANEFPRKGLGPVLEALALLGREDVHLVVAGRGDPAPYHPHVDRLGLSGRVHFLGHQPAAPVYQAADLFVLPSTYEGWGLVVGEALACGLPVVASRFPGSVEMVEPGVNGLLLDDPTDARELALKLEAAIDPTMLAFLSSRARPSVARYAWMEVCRQLVDLGVKGAASR